MKKKIFINMRTLKINTLAGSDPEYKDNNNQQRNEI